MAQQDNSLDYFNENQLASNVWDQKYAITDLEGNQEEDTPDEMHMRMAKRFASVSDEYLQQTFNAEQVSKLSEYGKKRNNLSSSERVYNLLEGFRGIIPQGSIMSMLGNPYQIGSTSNCIVIPDAVDSYGGIMYTDQQLAQLMKRRCGVGVDISKLRPKGATTQNAARSSTGAASFALRFSDTTNEVAQEGRRGRL